MRPTPRAPAKPAGPPGWLGAGWPAASHPWQRAPEQSSEPVSGLQQKTRHALGSPRPGPGDRGGRACPPVIPPAHRQLSVDGPRARPCYRTGGCIKKEVWPGPCATRLRSLQLHGAACCIQPKVISCAAPTGSWGVDRHAVGVGIPCGPGVSQARAHGWRACGGWAHHEPLQYSSGMLIQEDLRCGTKRKGGVGGSRESIRTCVRPPPAQPRPAPARPAGSCHALEGPSDATPRRAAACARRAPHAGALGVVALLADDGGRDVGHVKGVVAAVAPPNKLAVVAARACRRAGAGVQPGAALCLRGSPAGAWVWAGVACRPAPPPPLTCQAVGHQTIVPTQHDGSDFCGLAPRPQRRQFLYKRDQPLRGGPQLCRRAAGSGCVWGREWDLGTRVAVDGRPTHQPDRQQY